MAPDKAPIQDPDELDRAVRTAVARAPVTDMHTHLYTPGFGDLLLWGIDELLTYHYLVAEVFRYAPMPYEDWWALPKRAQADHVWRHVFLEHSPVSEAARGVLTTLRELGLDPASRDLDAYRAYFADKSVTDHVDDVLRIANVTSLVMTNDPFDDLERPRWMDRGPDAAEDGRFHAALRIDPLLSQLPAAAPRLREWGYEAGDDLDEEDRAQIRRFLGEWIDRMNAVYVAASLAPTFDPFDEQSPGARVLRDCVLPVARDRNVPVALMIGVKKLINPGLRLAGDGVGKMDIRAVERLCALYENNKFLVTLLARENQHELCVAARKYPNLMIFGCWWFLNIPELVDEITSLRTELLGLSFVPQHSDARVLDQVIYKWLHSRRLIADALARHYRNLHETGWRPTAAEVDRDVRVLFGDNFRRFVER